MSRPALVHIALAALFSLLLSMPQGLLVMCSGDDGHHSLEVACDCVDAACGSDEVSPELEQGCGCVNECGSCWDTRIGNSLDGTRPARFDNASGSALGRAKILFPLAAVAPAAADLCSPPFSVPRTSTPGTIILRI